MWNHLRIFFVLGEEVHRRKSKLAVYFLTSVVVEKEKKFRGSASRHETVLFLSRKNCTRGLRKLHEKDKK